MTFEFNLNATANTCGDAAPIPVKQEPIAIIGMAARTPGAANTAQLWELLERGVNTVSEIPRDRFNVPPQVSASLGGPPAEIGVQMGNFMTDFTEFDNKFFNISPREAKSMDPQQRLLLHTAYEALENAGYVPDATPCFQRDNFGCYVGSTTREFCENLASDIDIYYIPGTVKAFLSGRISYAMQFGGPSVVADTACSASIVSIHQACRALMNRDCDAALAGGVNVMTSPNSYIGLERGHFLSPSGQCKVFDADADGYSRGEGCCLFVLKRLSDAIAENDNIAGVIRGVELNQSGQASSITHPHGGTQVELLRKVLEYSGISPGRVSAVEAHGTGTQAGDYSEVESLRSILCKERTQDNPLHITSIKGNIGHLESAAGAVGLCKILLMLRNNMIPAQISLKKLHPLIAPLEIDNTVINTVPAPWVAGSTPRVAVLNNYGASGSNGSLVVEEYVKANRDPVTSTFVFGISAKSAEALENLRSKYVQWLSDTRTFNTPFCDIAYTATARRQIYPFRLAVSAKDNNQLHRVLSTSPITHVESDGGRVFFVFPGQGSQYMEMGASLYGTSAVFKSCIDRCEQHLVSLGYPGIMPIISSGHSEKVFGASEEFEAYQCAIVAVEFALSTLWKHWGVIPAGVIGHSLGEYAAMVAAGVLSIETALSIVAKSARLMTQACAIGKTGMVSVTLSSTQVQRVLASRSSFSNLTIACVNTESSCVVSGPVEELETLMTHLKDAFGCKATTLQIPLGFHSAAMDPILDDLKEHVATLSIHPPSIPIASNVHGSVVSAGDDSVFDAEYFVAHTRQPVLFSQGLRELEQSVGPSQIDAWIDVGPQPICLYMVKSTLSPSPKTLCLASMVKETSTLTWDTLMGGLAQLYRTNVPVDWRRVFDERTTCFCVEVPSYPFNAKSFWKPYSSLPIPRISEPAPLRQPLDHPMLASWSQYPSRQNGNSAIFETPISSLAQYIEGHMAGSYALCPLSVYLEQALAAAAIAQRHTDLDFGRCMPILHAVQLPHPLVYHRDIPLVVRTHVTVNEDGTGSFKISSRLDSSGEEHVHANGDLRFSSVRETTSNLALNLPKIARPGEVPASQGQAPEVFRTRTIYEMIFTRVVQYSKDYQAIQSLTIDGDDICVARIAMQGSLNPQSIFLDTLVHAPGFVLNMQAGDAYAYICNGLGSLTMLRELVENKQPYMVYSVCNRTAGDIVTADISVVLAADPSVVVAQIKGVEFRRIQVSRMKRVMALAADTRRNQGVMRPTNVITPPTPRSVLSRAQSSAGYTESKEGDESKTNVSGSSSRTLVTQKRSSVDGDRIRRIMAEVLGISDSNEIKDNVDFGLLGLDSLGSIEAQQALSVALNKPIPHDVFSNYPTLAALCELLSDGTKHDVEEVVEVKVDVPRPQMPRPEKPRSSTDSKRIREIMAEVLGMSDSSEVKDNADFGSLGLDSLGSIEAQQALSVALNRPIPHDVFTNYPTLAALCELLSDGVEHEVEEVVEVKVDVPRPQMPRSEKPKSSTDNKRIRAIMAEVLGMSDSSEVKDDVDLGSLGLDSLGSIEAQQALSVELNKPIPHDIFTMCSTFSALCAFLSDDVKDADISSVKTEVVEKPRPALSDVKTGGGVSQERPRQSSNVAFVPLQQCPGSSHPPLYLVHDGSGLSTQYEHLLTLDRDVWGISNPRFFSGEPWESLGDMAGAYALAIKQHTNSACVMLGGWSFGGNVAFEISRALASLGVKTQGVVLLDSPPPFSPPSLSDNFMERVLEAWGHSIQSSRTSLVFRQFKQSRDLLGKYVARTQADDVPLAFVRCTGGFCPDGLPLEEVPTWFKERDDITQLVGPWETLVGRSIPFWDVPGDHFEPFSSAYVKETSTQVIRACEYLESL